MKHQDGVGDTPDTSRSGTRQAAAIVGIGASAGGLDAVTELLDALPADTGLGLVLVQHLAPSHPSMLVELLARHTSMPVQEARQGIAVEPDHLYVIPPGADLGILHGVLQVLPWPEEHHGPLLAVDHFLRSLARDQGPRAIAVILSGSASDGALGTQAVKGEGGITLAQDEASAQHTSMPHSAVATGAVDLVLPPARIATELARIARAPRQRPVDEQGGLGGELDTILVLLRDLTGHDFTGYKPNTLERRIRRRLVLHDLHEIGQYIRYLRESPDEAQALFEDLLISVTAFFRDPDAFDVLKERVFPRLVKGRAANAPIRIWVPGCAGGEEAYSLAIALAEYLAAGPVPAQPVQVFASDIDERAILKARAGLYPESIAADVSAERLKRFFVKTAHGYQVRKAIRDLCVFAVQDLTRDPPFSRMDLVTCRNLLIYFGPELQKKVLGTLYYALNPHGFLMLGSSESVGNAVDLFSLEDKQFKIYEKKHTRAPMPNPSGSWSIGHLAGSPLVPSAVGGAPERDLVREAEQHLLAEFGPPALIVDERMDVVSYSGRTGPYIEPAQGAASTKLLRVVRRELTAALHVGVRKALETHERVRQEGVRYRGQTGERCVDLVVAPLPTVPGHVLVVFEEAAVPEAASSAPPAPDGEHARRAQTLDQELAATRAQLQAIVSEQVNTGEALRAAYEELLSSNEELQGTNEELESSKEELQSTNEELATVNEELVVRNSQLKHAHDDLLNLLTNAELPIVMLDGELRVRHFTPMARPLLNLIDADVGRPLEHLRTNLDIEDLGRYLREVIDQGSRRTIEVRDRADRWYSLRLRPYRSRDGAIEGAVLVFVDLAEFSAGQAQVHRLAAMVRESADAIILMALDGRILEWNRGAEAVYGYTESEAQRMNLTDLVPPAARPQVEDMLRQLAKGDTLRSVEAQRVTRDGRELTVRFTASPLAGLGGTSGAVVAIEQDISDIKHNLEQAQWLAAVVRNAADAITVRDLQGRIRAWNPAAQRMYGYSEEEALGLSVERLLPADARSREAAIAQRLRRGEPVEGFRSQRVTRDGRIIAVEVTASLVLDDTGRPQAMATTERAIGKGDGGPGGSQSGK